MELRVDVTELVIVSWATEPEEIERVLPPGLEPHEIDGEHLISVAGIRYSGGRAGRIPVPGFSQLNVRVYTTWEGEPAVLFLDLRVSPAGTGAKFLGLPVRASRVRVRPGLAEAPGLGFRAEYQSITASDPGLLGRHELGLLPMGAELQGFRVRRGPTQWHEALATEPVRADPLLAMGFDLGEPYSLVCASDTTFQFELRPQRLRRSVKV